MLSGEARERLARARFVVRAALDRHVRRCRPRRGPTTAVSAEGQSR
jgi:hypothetical protein